MQICELYSSLDALAARYSSAYFYNKSRAREIYNTNVNAMFAALLPVVLRVRERPLAIYGGHGSSSFSHLPMQSAFAPHPPSHVPDRDANPQAKIRSEFVALVVHYGMTVRHRSAMRQALEGVVDELRDMCITALAGVFDDNGNPQCDIVAEIRRNMTLPRGRNRDPRIRMLWKEGLNELRSFTRSAVTIECAKAYTAALMLTLEEDRHGDAMPDATQVGAVCAHFL